MERDREQPLRPGRNSRLTVSQRAGISGTATRKGVLSTASIA